MPTRFQHGASCARACLCALLAALLLLACGGGRDAGTTGKDVMAPLLQAAGADARSGASAAQVYSVINLGTDATLAAALNARGQALFSHIGHGGPVNGFFDGERIHEIGSLGGGYTVSRALNNAGVVVGESSDPGQPVGTLRAFAWTAAGGMRALPSESHARARAINDAGQAAGHADIGGITAHAARWSANGSLALLGPRAGSEAAAINQHGASAGSASTPAGTIHAMRWDADGSAIDLGTLGGSMALGEFINARGDIAGVADSTDGQRLLAFFWSADGGMQAIGAEGWSSRLVVALGDHGDVAGNTLDGEVSRPYLWSRRRGLALLPLGGAHQGEVLGLNRHGQMVGSLQQGAGRHAVFWSGITTPVVLNTRLSNAPPGLRLTAGAAINADGVILAQSNAGLVLLRPGRRGSDAPVLGPLLGLPDTIAVGDTVHAALGFIDNAPGQTHTAGIDWGDGCASRPPLVHEARGAGRAVVAHSFCAPGFFTLTVRIAGSGGRTTVLRRDYVVE